VEARELTLIARFDERAHEIGGAREEDTATSARRFDAEGDGEVRLSSADRAGEDEIVGTRDPFAAGERGRSVSISVER
jgi:hypothetical protein